MNVLIRYAFSQYQTSRHTLHKLYLFNTDNICKLYIYIYTYMHDSCNLCTVEQVMQVMPEGSCPRGVMHHLGCHWLPAQHRSGLLTAQLSDEIRGLWKVRPVLNPTITPESQATAVSPWHNRRLSIQLIIDRRLGRGRGRNRFLVLRRDLSVLTGGSYLLSK